MSASGAAAASDSSSTGEVLVRLAQSEHFEDDVALLAEGAIAVRVDPTGESVVLEHGRTHCVVTGTEARLPEGARLLVVDRVPDARVRVLPWAAAADGRLLVELELVWLDSADEHENHEEMRLAPGTLLATMSLFEPSAAPLAATESFPDEP